MDETMLATQKAEHALLGALILEAAGLPGSGIIGEIAKIVKPEDFLDTTFGEHLHTRIYQSILNLAGPLNEVTIPLEMAKTGPLPRGTHAEFAILNAACPCWVDWESYTKAVREYSDTRNPNRKRKPDIKGGCNLA